MKKSLIALLICALLSGHTYAQIDISFQLIYVKEIKTSVDDFGGISAIDLLPRQLMDSQIHKNDSGGSLYLVSDHTGGGLFKKPESFTFQLNKDNNICCRKPFFGMVDIECVRYNEWLDNIFFSFESDNGKTGIGMVKPGQNPVNVFDTCICIDNRGIEGITFASDHSLWFAYESGVHYSDTAIPFFNIKGVSTGPTLYKAVDKIAYQYPFDKCYCLNASDCPKFDGSWGNGVSEILALKGYPDKLLVMERCFDKGRRKGSSRLYLASVQPESKLLLKEMLYDFNSNGLEADNLEGMAWGDNEEGYPMLYIVSDNNFNDRQKNQIIKLRMTVKEK